VGRLARHHRAADFGERGEFQRALPARGINSGYASDSWERSKIFRAHPVRERERDSRRDNRATVLLPLPSSSPVIGCNSPDPSPLRS
jgi:hypothetical protein